MKLTIKFLLILLFIIFKEKFVFKNISYDKEKDYYLVITDEATGIESSRVRFIIDIAITNNFEF